jgi:hypothetical protein
MQFRQHRPDFWGGASGSGRRWLRLSRYIRHHRQPLTHRGERMPPTRPHLVANAGDASAVFLVLQGIGEYDFVPLTTGAPIAASLRVRRRRYWQTASRDSRGYIAVAVSVLHPGTLRFKPVQRSKQARAAGTPIRRCTTAYFPKRPRIIVNPSDAPIPRFVMMGSVVRIPLAAPAFNPTGQARKIDSVSAG